MAAILVPPLPVRKPCAEGRAGTIVGILGPKVFEVEFADNEGRTYAALALNPKQLLVLHYQSV